LFQQLGTQNVETLSKHHVKRIVAHCPHCVNSLRNDYPQLGGNYDVLHHSQLLADLVSAGRLVPQERIDSENGTFTYHDPCYLARVGGVTEPPRAVLTNGTDAANRSQLIELPRNRRHTSCCGAGGGRMWFDDPPTQRVGQGRVREIADSGADTVAVSCPFCLIMLSDGLAAQNPGARVRDIAEVLAERVLGPEPSAQQ
jgi:Fe-S oxidoreductase